MGTSNTTSVTAYGLKVISGSLSAVRHILITDPGRWPFDDLCELMSGRKGVSIIEHQIDQPKKVEGKILKISL